MGVIYLQIGIILFLVLVLGLVAYGDWRTTKKREDWRTAKKREAEEKGEMQRELE